MTQKVRIPVAMQERAAEVIAVTDEVCLTDLDGEYAKLARRLVARLARKRPSPLTRGNARIWAAGVLYVLAQVNFLFDRTQSPHMSATELAAAVGVKQTTMANKAGLINRSLGIGMFEPELTRVAMLEQHPLAWIRAQQRPARRCEDAARGHAGRGAQARPDPRHRGASGGGVSSALSWTR